jgi:uncharacterized membrane protein
VISHSFDHEHLFQIIAIILTVIGSAADYGSFGRWPLLVATLIYWGSMFSTMSLTCKSPCLVRCMHWMLKVLQLAPSRWGIAMGIYTIAFISYSVTISFYAAAFPRLARNTRHVRELRERYDQGKITADEYDQAEALEKSKISSLSMVRTLLALPSPVMTCCFRLLAQPVSS